MLRSVKPRVWAFDAEWVPDPLAGRVLYNLPESLREPAEILKVMWERAGATPQDPTPFLKLAQCRVISIAAVERRETASGVNLLLLSLPRDTRDPAQCSEAHVLGTFLAAVGRNRPQLVGFNSLQSDLKLFGQRATILGLRAPEYCERPDKPWEGIDYFARGSEFNVDLMDLLGGFGSARPSLHELAVQSGIPGKLDIDGDQVARLWLEGQLDRIVQYNEFDALTTYLLWLRVAHLAGHFTTEGYAEEQARVRELLAREIAGGKTHLTRYTQEWERLQGLTASRC